MDHPRFAPRLPVWRSFQQHALDCMKGGYRTIQHNEVRDVMAQLMKEAGHTAVETEPVLQPLHGEHFERKSANTQDDARSDIKCTGFWRHMRGDFTFCQRAMSD